MCCVCVVCLCVTVVTRRVVTYLFTGDNKKHGQTLSRRRELILTVMTSFFLFLYVGIESSYGGWIFTYARENFPSMPEWEAASLSSSVR